MYGRIRIGIGGWSFAPWRGVFYPDGLRQKDELSYASQRLGVIEINATYHSLQSRASYERCAAETPVDFRFTVKGSRFCTNRRELASAGEAVARFFAQGMDALGDKLGPILWQFMPFKRFDAADMAAFLDLLPATLDRRPLRHALEVRHTSFADPAFADLCRSRQAAICLSDSPDWPLIDEPTADFAYARLMRGQDEVESGYPEPDLDAWAARLGAQAEAGREVFAFFISGGKKRAPAAAISLARRLGQEQESP